MNTLFENDAVHIAQTIAGNGKQDFAKFYNTKFNHAGLVDDTNDLYDSFNLGLHVGDDPRRVLDNRAKLLIALPHAKRIVWLNQVHGNHIEHITKRLDNTLLNADALITECAGVALAIMTADCVPVAIFDEHKVACVHAGWQGLVAGIINKTCQHISTQKYAYIGACISGAAYEVSYELARRIVDDCVRQRLVEPNADELFAMIVKPSTSVDKVLLDIATLAKLQLMACDVQLINQDIACSYHDERFYSYRAQTHAGKRATGRMAMLITKKTNK
ncbi:MAG: polyphenol oxidase family protein [Moraxella sp.]|nr:polyphenol oxidase family protein [Moraxella sp.]